MRGGVVSATDSERGFDIVEALYAIIDEDGDGSIDIEGFTRLVTECKLLDGDLAAPTPTAATSTDIERTRTSRRPELTRRPSLAMLSAKETVDRVEQLRLEASKAAALVDSEAGHE